MICNFCFPFINKQHTRLSRRNNSLKIIVRCNSEGSEVVSSRSESLNSIARATVMLRVTAMLSIFPASIKIANARQGAFEMDLEYYLKTVTNRAKGIPDSVTINSAKTNKPMLSSPRSINKDLATDVIDIIHQEISNVSNSPISIVIDKVKAQTLLFLPYFKEFVPIKHQDYSDQYYFDITLYVSYIVAAQLIPKSTDRVILRKAVGDNILALMINKKLVNTSIITPKNMENKMLLLDNNKGKHKKEITLPSEAAERMAVLAKGVTVSSHNYV